MISKELFARRLPTFKKMWQGFPLIHVGVVDEQDRKISEFDHALGKICDSAVVFDADNLNLAALL